MLIDTHAHLNFSAYKDDLDEVLRRTLKKDVWMINVGSQYSTSFRAVEIASRYPEGVYAAVGLHPIHLSSGTFHDKVDDQEEFDVVSRVEEYDKDKYRELASRDRVVAIGEVGLDYYHAKDNPELQKEVFEKQIDLACEMDLPILIHCREAHNDTIEMLRKKKGEQGDRLRGAVHSFGGNLKQAQIYTAELGFYLGFNGIVTFTDSYDKVLKNIDIKYFLLETDCPYLSPIPHRGERNEPSYVEFVAQKIARIKEITAEEVAEITCNNAKNLFKI